MKTHCMTFVLLLLGSTSFSQVFVKSDAAGSNDGSSWANAYTSLDQALADAPENEEIWVASGTYLAGQAGDPVVSTYFTMDKPLSLYGGFEGTETDLDQRDIGANPTILSADLNGDDVPGDFSTNRTDNGYHVILMTAESEGALIDGFTIVGGNTKFGDPPNDTEISEWAGAGIFANSSFTVKNCSFNNNQGAIGAALTSIEGAVVTVQGSHFEGNNSTFGTLGMQGHQSAEVVNCEFVGNTASEFGGGATVGNSNVTFLDCKFTDNQSMDEGAGGLFIFQNNESLVSDASIVLENCEFTGNSAPFAGGLLMNNFADGIQLTMLNCLFDNNSATDADGMGGGFSIRNRAGINGASNLSVSILDCEITNNTAEHAAGALLMSRDFNLNVEISNTVISNNESNISGGGMMLSTVNNGRIAADFNGVEFRGNSNEVSGAGLEIDSGNDVFPIQANLTNCIFEDNSTSGLGAGLVLNTNSPGFSPGPTVTIEGCSFFNNQAEACCGGVWASASRLTVLDSEFEGNSTSADFQGGGAIGLMENGPTEIVRSSFTQNSSLEHGGAIYQSTGGMMIKLENVLINENMGESVVFTEDSLSFLNVSLLANEAGIYTEADDAVLEFQNTILADNGDNFDPDGDVEVISHGGNLSNDNSLEDYLQGSGAYDDQHSISPMLGNDFVPNMGSPCVDRGNPEGIDASATDAAGEARIQGDGIDVGAYESGFTLTAVQDQELASSIDVFPNPFSDELNVRAEQEPQEVRLYDMQGRLVEAFQNAGTQIDVNNGLPAGQYVLELIFAEGTVQNKVVKE